MRILVSVAAILSCVVTPSAVAESMSANLIDPAVEQRVDAIMKEMTLEQKIAQMIQPEIKSVTPQDIRRYGFGSILNGGGSFPQQNKQATIADWVALADSFYEASVDTSGGHAGIPIMWGTDAVHGHNNVLGATIFPHNICLGAARNPALIEAIGAATAREVRATGIDWIFAPTVAVVKDNRWGRTYEGYSDRPEIVRDYAEAVVRGLQSENMVATAKHFVGDGGTFRGIDRGDTRLSLEDLLAQHAAGYETALKAGVMSVMASFNSLNCKKIHGSKTILTDVLKDCLGFDGFIISDWNGIGEVEGCTNSNCSQSVNAGMDMIMAPEDWQALYYNMIEQVKSGEIPESRVDDAVRRILRVKALSGILDKPKPSTAALDASVIGQASHLEIARQAVRESLVLLNNNHNTLPLKADQNILVAGAAADDIGQQSGGWTITWQGTGNQNSDFPGGQSILDGLQMMAEKNGAKIQFSVTGEFSDRPDVAVVVFGETPYAEGQGDIDSLNYGASDAYSVVLLQRLKSQGIPTIAIFLTGRPMWINPELNNSDAFVVAWLPGTEGLGVAEVLFAEPGTVTDFKGRLPFNWPSIDTDPRDPDQPVTSVLFPYGYGLTLGETTFIRNDLNEQPVLKRERAEQIIFNARTYEPWSMAVGDNSNWRVPIATSFVRSAEGSVLVRTVDVEVQEDARQLVFGKASVGVAQAYWFSETPLDFSAWLEQGAYLLMDYRIDAAPEGDVVLRMDCTYPCTGEIQFNEVLQDVTLGAWQKLAIPLACFAERGADLATITAPLVVATADPFAITYKRVAIAAEAEAEAVLNCQ